MLLNCCSTPCVIFLTLFFSKAKYRFRRYVGAAGLIVVFSDVHAADRSIKCTSHLAKGGLSDNPWLELIEGEGKGAGIFCKNHMFDWMYFIAFAAVVVGLAVHSGARVFIWSANSCTLKKLLSHHAILYEELLPHKGDKEVEQNSADKDEVEQSKSFDEVLWTPWKLKLQDKDQYKSRETLELR
ncbi:hypothetical protein LguiB_018425 [Lonicera macranthoides]